MTTEELIELQKADETIEKYWDLSKQPSNINKKVSFIEKKGILYRSYSDKRGNEIRLLPYTWRSPQDSKSYGLVTWLMP